jgi:uncharacterized protein (TIGR00725 family)
MSYVIAVIGSGGVDKNLLVESLFIAEQVGEEIAARDLVLLTGGKGGVMRAACKGAKKKNGITIGILPFSKDEANEFVDIALPSNMGHGRNRLIVSMADAIIAITGRWGTLNEISEALLQQKPLVFLRGTGGIVDELFKQDVLSECEFVSFTTSSSDAVNQALDMINMKNESKH